MTENAWWDEFFADHWGSIQSGGYSSDRTIAECDAIVAKLDLSSGARVLDIPCGIGRHTIELCRRGLDVTGVDFNSDYLATAKAEAARASVTPRFFQGDMRSFSAESPFDAAFCFFGSFGYFSDTDNLQFLKSVAVALRPRGSFLIDTHVAETFFPIYRQRDWFPAGPDDHPLRVLEERSWDAGSGRINTTWTVIDGTSTRSKSTSIRIYTVRELLSLLDAAGFASAEVLDGNTGHPISIGSPRAHVVAHTP